MDKELDLSMFGKQVPLGGMTPGGRRTKFPFSTLGEGEYFVIPCGRKPPNHSSVSGLCQLRGKELGCKFGMRRLPDNSVLVFRR